MFVLMRKILLFLAFFVSISLMGQSYFANPFNPCSEDTAFSILAFEPVINGVPITDPDDVIIQGFSNGTVALPEEAIEGDKINLSLLETDVNYGLTIVSTSQSAFFSTTNFVIRDLAGQLSLMDNHPGVTTVEFCETQTLAIHFEHAYPEAIESYILNYGDGIIDTLDSLSFIEHRYRSIDSFPVDLTLVSGNGGCDLTYRNFAVVRDANGLRIGTVIGDTVDCVGDTNGVITLYSEFGGTPPYMYAFSTSPFGYNRAHDKLAAGYYKVSLRDANGCIADTAIRVKSPDPILTTYDIDYPLCDDSELGSITIDSIKGGWGEYTYVWNGVEGDRTLSDVSSNSSNVLFITDAKSCFVVDTINVDSCIATSSIEELVWDNGLAVYPNPAIGKIFWVESKDRMESIALYDLMGRRLDGFQISDFRFRVDLQYRNAGIYFIEVETERSSYTQRVLVE